MIVAYTIGNTKSYDRALTDDLEHAEKVGKNYDYEGGYIWKTFEEANTFINSEAFLQINWGDEYLRHPEDFSVYKVYLSNGYDDISSTPGKDGEYYLLVNSRFNK